MQIGLHRARFVEPSSEPASSLFLRLSTLLKLLAFTIPALLLVLALEMPGTLDYPVTHALNSMLGRSALLDYGLYSLTRDMFSSLILVTFIWYVWFDTTEAQGRAEIAVGVVMSFVAGILSRGLQVTLPTHLRPAVDPNLHNSLPLSIKPDSFNLWPCFPSDHAAVFFGLAITIYFANRRLGVLAMSMGAFFSLVRIYLGFHYPTDILGGAYLALLVLLLARPLARLAPVLRFASLSIARQPLFYAVSFYVCFGVTTLFSDYREVVSPAAKMIKAHLHHNAKAATGLDRRAEVAVPQAVQDPLR